MTTFHHRLVPIVVILRGLGFAYSLSGLRSAGSCRQLTVHVWHWDHTGKWFFVGRIHCDWRVDCHDAGVVSHRLEDVLDLPLNRRILALYRALDAEFTS